MAGMIRKQALRLLVFLALCEFALLGMALYVAVDLRFYGDAQDMIRLHDTLGWRVFVFAAVLLLGMAAMGQYQLQMRSTWFGVLARQAVGFVLGGLTLLVLYYVIPRAYIGRGVLGIALVLGFVLVTIFRLIFLRFARIESLKRRILVLGAGNRAAQLMTLVRDDADRFGFRIVGFVPCHGEDPLVDASQLLPQDISLAALARREQIDEIVVAVDDRRGGMPMDALLECRQLGIEISDMTRFFELESGRLQLSFTDPSWLVFSGGFSATALHRFSKRCFDLSLSLLVLLLTWPLMLLVALAIRLESGPGQPILYVQERVGALGKTFKLYKFRSMRTDAERDGVARWAKQNDDRVTRVGRFIRKTRLDELPQLWNVLKGEMSLIGPRPERPQFVADLSHKLRYYSLRHCLKPGLAGWAQLRYPYGASDEDAAEKLKYDLYYVKNHSLLFDCLILIQTVEVVLFGRGAR
ncbi:MAG: TIGR03013 family PEP-CTERM/XrtA system glycosyltransferase [Betaproteobacteria bacterium]|jgi:sugar transferase (PEP-CTERM system associated)|nr:TIGR03013 family PEP-CTERM/XrtA system glycosyltransferase [Betaproteobacteria bacterium]